MDGRGAIHQRWIAELNRSNDENDPEYRDTWPWEQCGGCLFWMPLAGPLGTDWGVCANALSPFDRRAMFEHDGCDSFSEDPEGWRAPGRAPIPTGGQEDGTPSS
jgi:hypothetical protein